MWFTTHALCGMVLSTSLTNLPWLAVTAIASHFVLDLIPHEDTSYSLNTLFDIAAGIIIGVTLWIIYSPGVPFLWGTLWAVLPDSEVLLQEMGYISRRYFPPHLPAIHGVLRGKRGIAVNLVTAAFFFFLYLILV